MEAVKTKGSAAGPFIIYCASKTLAEKAAWEFVTAHNSEISCHVAVAAEAHVRATHAAAAGGQRIVLRSGPFFYQDIRESHNPPFLPFVFEADEHVKLSYCSSGARYPECATWRAKLNERCAV